MSQIKLFPDKLEKMLDRVARRGVKKTLAPIGFLEDTAHKYMTEMRNLLEACRDTRKSISTTAIKVTTVAVLTFIAGAVYMTMDK